MLHILLYIYFFPSLVLEDTFPFFTETVVVRYRQVRCNFVELKICIFTGCYILHTEVNNHIRYNRKHLGRENIFRRLFITQNFDLQIATTFTELIYEVLDLDTYFKLFKTTNLCRQLCRTIPGSGFVHCSLAYHKSYFRQ